ncbi:MATE family efflux transporter [Mesorhizobium mediterraneum]|uniref:Multidrug-efflux transporter n=1 Tax=Mesorhizobium mediterraneum TaxID=43617 RepID=A0AB36RAP1_9HYPH|nr:MULTISPECIES: MATE family efflux transporter [Mesorhizobium]PAQ01968.1 MATE family efflux transporter [Mesorhizobium mediterraneum]RUU98374.1 MATE family efflux transporter [Mesorhizobium sp. M6A.T.Cr.TU.017.01.1.1]RVB77171.1 MATE family efflux transporter [Mesorhizobium sp. M6A.T.Cr.TU.014.01.1.1]RWN41977.1 MAG: MATE family efflux transporter [Mesorhizobium sp.]RWP02954.1 MAG: MATE family efflux transporter [Mesorhizobium sp.]
MSAIEAGARAPENLWRQEIRATLALAWPMVLTNLGQTAMTATDVMMMGRLGPDTLASGALGANLYFMPLIFGLGLMLATSPMIATELGRRRHSVRDLRRTVRQGLWLAILICIPIWIFLWHGEAVLLAMGQEPALAHQAGIYLRWLEWAVLPFYGYIVLRSFISALERPGWALVIVFVAVACNALFNWVFMFGNLGIPSMGIAGSGLATTLSSMLMFVGMAAVVMLEPKFRRYRLFGRFWRADWPRFKGLLRLGLPIAGLLAFEVTIFNAAALLMGLIDADSLAAHAIAIQIASISFMVPLGLNQAATVRVGLAHGASDAEGVSRAGWTAFVIGVSFMALMGLAMILWPQLLISAFIDLGNPANARVIGLAVSFLAFAALFQIFDGAQAVAAGMLRGLHDTTVPMIYAAIGYWGIGLPLGVLLAFHSGLNGVGIWIGLSLGLAVVAALLLARWLRRDRIAPPISFGH